MTWIKVASTNDIKEGNGKELNINGQRIALFLSNKKYYAIEALCRHQDGSLAPGKIQGEVVECPLHFWHYNIRTGELLDYMEGVKLNIYPVEIRKDEIYLEI
jgi:nitrite reductase (NADH) small subunit